MIKGGLCGCDVVPVHLLVNIGSATNPVFAPSDPNGLALQFPFPIEGNQVSGPGEEEEEEDDDEEGGGPPTGPPGGGPPTDPPGSPGSPGPPGGQICLQDYADRGGFALFLRDFDQDGDIDVRYLTGARNPNCAPGNFDNVTSETGGLINDNNNFVPGVSPPEVFSIFEGIYLPPYYVDIDQDGDQDVVIPISNYIIDAGFHINTGNTEMDGTPVYERIDGHFGLPSARRPSFGDLDCDGDLDVVHRASEGISVWENIGSNALPQFVNEFTHNGTDAPTAICKNSMTVQLNANGTASIAVSDIDDGSSDACGIKSMSLNVTSFDCDDLGENTVTLTVEDDDDNEKTCSATITVQDLIKPTISCSNLSLTVSTDDGSCEAAVDLAVPSSADNCGVANMQFRYRPVNENNQNIGGWQTGWTDESETENFAFPVGKYRIKWRAKDSANNPRQCNYFITVEDNEQPSINCSDKVITFNGEEEIDLVAEDFATATDNCGIGSLILDINTVDCQDLGTSFTVTATAKDIHGWEKTCQSSVTVEGLPCGWSQEPDGVGCEDGNTVDYDLANESFSVNSIDCSNAITSGSDEFAFTQYNLCANGSITAKITNISGSSNGWAGVFMRASNDPQAKSVAMMTNKASNHRKEVRSTTGGNVTSQLMPAFNRHWLRITRSGNSFRIYTSSNGISWFMKASHTIVMEECIEVGLVANGYVSDNDITAAFEHVNVVGETYYQLNTSTSSGDELEERINITAKTKSGVHVYPNPTTGVINVNWDKEQLLDEPLKVFNTQGHLVRSISVFENNTRFDLSDLPAGMYFIQVKMADGNTLMERIVLSKM